MALAHKVAVLNPSDVTEEELNALSTALDGMADDMADYRREGDLIEFVTHVVESLRQGHEIALYALEKEV